jgi:hypothetical protein
VHTAVGSHRNVDAMQRWQHHLYRRLLYVLLLTELPGRAHPPELDLRPVLTGTRR